MTLLMLRKVLLFQTVPNPPNSAIVMIRFPNRENLMSKNKWNCKVLAERPKNTVFVREETTQKPHYTTALLYVTGLTVSVVVIWKLVCEAR